MFGLIWLVKHDIYHLKFHKFFDCINKIDLEIQVVYVFHIDKRNFSWFWAIRIFSREFLYWFALNSFLIPAWSKHSSYCLSVLLNFYTDSIYIHYLSVVKLWCNTTCLISHPCYWYKTFMRSLPDWPIRPVPHKSLQTRKVLELGVCKIKPCLIIFAIEEGRSLYWLNSCTLNEVPSSNYQYWVHYYIQGYIQPISFVTFPVDSPGFIPFNELWQVYIIDRLLTPLPCMVLIILDKLSKSDGWRSLSGVGIHGSANIQ